MIKKFQDLTKGYLQTSTFLVIYSIVGTLIFTYVFENKSDGGGISTPLVFGYLFSLPFCLGGNYFFEGLKRQKDLVVAITIIAFCLAFGVALNFEELPQFQLHLSILAFLLFMISPVAVRKHEQLGFHWYVSIGVAFISSFITSLVLFGLICFLVWILKELLRVELPDFINHLGIAFFLVFIPLNIFAIFSPKPRTVESLRYSLPSLLEKTIRVLFIPTMLIYIVVLLVYAMKILIVFSLPNGMISKPISIAYTMFFVLSAYIESQRKESEGIWKYHRWFEVSFVPLFIMMGIGTWKRISDYGFTTERVYLLMIFVVLVSSLAIRLIYRRLEIRKLNYLCLVMVLVSSIGPLNPVNISIESQINRFVSAVSKYGSNFKSLNDLKITTWKRSDIDQIASALDFVVRNGGADRLIARASKDNLLAVGPGQAFSLKTDIEQSLRGYLKDHIDYRYRGKDKPDIADERVCISYDPHIKTRSFVTVTGFDLYTNERLYASEKNRQLKVDENHFLIIDKTLGTVSVLANGKAEMIIDYQKAVREFMAHASADTRYFPLILTGEGNGLMVKFILSDASIDCASTSVAGELYVKHLR